MGWKCFSNRYGEYIVTWRIWKPWWILDENDGENDIEDGEDY